MSTESDRVFRELKEINTKVGSLNVKLSSFIAADEVKTKRHDAAAKAVLGNGGIGLLHKVWVIWTLLGVLGVAVLALLMNWVKLHFSHVVC